MRSPRSARCSAEERTAGQEGPGLHALRDAVRVSHQTTGGRPRCKVGRNHAFLQIVEEKGLKQQSDPKALETLIDKIINDNREKAVEYKQGKEKLFGFFVGQAMKASGGKANPQLINEILKKKL